MAKFSKILSAEPHQSGAIELRVAADEIVRPGHEFIPLDVPPRFNIVVSAVAHDCPGIPILLFPRDEISALEEQYLLPRWSEPISKRAASCSGSNDDDVVLEI